MRGVVLGMLVLLLAGAAAAAAPARSLEGAIVKVAFNKKLKKQIVVDANGITLYYFTPDTGGQATCVGDQPAAGCGTVWPPLTTDGSPSAGAGAKASLLGTTTRSDGLVQVTYGGHPLYYFKGYQGTPADRKPGDIRGFAFYSIWFVLSPAGKPIMKYPRKLADASAPARTLVKVAFNAKVKQKILVDAKGLTLYLFTADTPGKSACVTDCLLSWPAVTTTGKPKAGNGVKAKLLGTITRDDGRKQVTYAGHPLYRFAGGSGFTADTRAGDAYGQGFGTIWWVVSPAGKPILK